MQWTESSLLLTSMPHGETSAIAHMMTRENGRYTGIVHGATSRRLAPLLQPGNQFMTTWRAKTADNLGWFRLELEKSRSVAVWADRTALAGLTSVCSLLGMLLPEREPYPELYDVTLDLVDSISTLETGNEAIDGWLAKYALWEKELIAEIGFGLKLDRCTVTGTRNDLVYISPKSGRAVSEDGAGEWINRLLPLPKCYQSGKLADSKELMECMLVSGHFINKALESVSSRLKPPAARDRFVSILKQRQ